MAASREMIVMTAACGCIMERVATQRPGRAAHKIAKICCCCKQRCASCGRNLSISLMRSSISLLRSSVRPSIRNESWHAMHGVSLKWFCCFFSRACRPSTSDQRPSWLEPRKYTTVRPIIAVLRAVAIIGVPRAVETTQRPGSLSAPA